MAYADAMRRLLVSLILLGAVIALATFWYAVVERFGLLDGLYQAVTTITTVGFREVQPLDTSGRLFTIVYILGGIGLMFYVATALVERVVLGEVALALGWRRVSRKVERMRDHFIVCGYGRVGREVVEELRERGLDVVVIDREAEPLQEARARGCATVTADATEEPALRDAGVERARVLIAAADADVANTYIVLTARALNPDLFLVARAGTAEGERRMRTAGANRVISPYQIGGRRMAVTAVQPLLIDFVDLVSAAQPVEPSLLAQITIEEAGEPLAGRTVAEVFAGDERVRVLGLQRASGEFIVGPGGSTRLQPGDRLMLYGEEDAVEELAERSADRRRADPSPGAGREAGDAAGMP